VSVTWVEYSYLKVAVIWLLLGFTNTA
jgi:hypothetical protein